MNRDDTEPPVEAEAEAPSTETATPNEPAKAPAQNFVLRGAARRVVRFRRTVLIGISATAIAAVITVAGFALRPSFLTQALPTSGAATAGDQRPPDFLSKAPRTYGDVPRLGPPLPGDLGRPILEHARGLAGANVSSPDPQAAQRQQTVLTEHQRQLADRKAALESGVMVQLAGGAIAAAAPTLPSPPAQATPAKAVTADPDHDPGGQQHKTDFISTRDQGGDSNPHDLMRASSPNILSAGSVIAASLLTGLNSDLPGLVTAQVTQNAYDSPTGHILLIPQGSRLIGAYDSVIAYGQQRALVVWQRIVFPDGSSVQIDNWPATDAAGYAGLADKIDRHTWQLLKGVVLSTLLGVGTELSFTNESDLVSAIRQSTQLSASRAGDQLVSKDLNVQPTIKIRPGWPLRVVIHKDLILTPWKDGRP